MTWTCGECRELKDVEWGIGMCGHFGVLRDVNAAPLKPPATHLRESGLIDIVSHGCFRERKDQA